MPLSPNQVRDILFPMHTLNMYKNGSERRKYLKNNARCFLSLHFFFPAQSVMAVEYADCIFVRHLLPNKCPGYDTKPSDGEVPVLELWGIGRTPSFSLLSNPLWPRVVVPVRVPSLSQIGLFNHLLYLKSFHCMQTNELWLFKK